MPSGLAVVPANQAPKGQIPLTRPNFGSSTGTVLYVAYAGHTDLDRTSFSAFDKLVETIEGNSSSASELQDARKWVASAFYGEELTLASLRLSAGLSQQQLGERCGFEQPHVSRYESGKHEPSLSTAMCMADALGISLETFSQAWKNTSSRARTETSR